MRLDLGNRQSDIHKSAAERDAIHQKAIQNREECLTLQAMVKELENANQRLEKDCLKYTREIDELKERNTIKENDLRNALTSLNESQRIHAEEKGTLRGELR